MGDEVIVSVRRLSFRYGPRSPYVLRDVSLRMCKGEVVAVLGPNGSGKSTLLKILSRIVGGYEGEIEVGGKGLLSYGLRDYARITAYVPQEEHLPLPFTLFEYVSLGRTPHMGLLVMSQNDVRRVHEAITRVGLQNIYRRRVSELSGGERQLARVARALAQEPTILLLDEPTSHLDLGNRVRVLKLIRGFARSGGAALLTTHDPNEALLIADRTYIISSGTIVAEGRPEDVIREDIMRKTYGTEVLEVDAEGRKIIIPTLPD
ncbi:MAG: ABC transporter ATP-binding protein [Zestosphaera sp.]